MRCKTRDHAKHGITLERGILGRSRNRAEQNPSQCTAWTTPEENHRPGRDRMQRPSTALQKGLTFPGPALCLRCLARSSPSPRAIGGAAGPAPPSPSTPRHQQNTAEMLANNHRLNHMLHSCFFCVTVIYTTFRDGITSRSDRSGSSHRARDLMDTH